MESSQAVNNSDFAIGRFHFLRRLLFVHGRENYRRLSIFAYYMFYKNVVLVLTMYLFSMFAMASSGLYYNGAYYDGYNVLYTGLPPIIFGFNDQVYARSFDTDLPKLYQPGLQRSIYTHRGFARWMLEGTALAVLAAFVPMLALGTSSLSAPHLGDPGFHQLSFFSMCITCFVTNMRLALEVYSWTFMEHIAIWGTLIVFEISCILFSFVTPGGAWETFNWTAWGPLYFMLVKVYAQPAFWLGTVLATTLALFPRFAHRGYEKTLAQRKEAKAHDTADPQAPMRPLGRPL